MCQNGTASLESLKEELLTLVGEENAERIDVIINKARQLPNGNSRLVSTILTPLRNLHIAFIVVDFQNDFVSGSLSIALGDAGDNPLEALPSLNSLVAEEQNDLVVYTQDWHPSNHISFYEHARNTDRELSADDKVRKIRPFDIVRFVSPDTIQVLYPTHCVQDSWGSEIHKDVTVVPNSVIVRKGKEVFVDAYSAFGDNHGKQKSELESVLRSSGINAILACGLAYDICVMHTVKDAANLGFLSAVVTDCSKGLSETKMEETNELFRKKKVAILDKNEAQQVIHRKTVPIEWVEKLAEKL